MLPAMRKHRLMLAALIAFLAAIPGSGAATTQPECRHGESSIIVEEHDGQAVVVQQPTLTGCVP